MGGTITLRDDSLFFPSFMEEVLLRGLRADMGEKPKVEMVSQSEAAEEPGREALEEKERLRSFSLVLDEEECLEMPLLGVPIVVSRGPCRIGGGAKAARGPKS